MTPWNVTVHSNILQLYIFATFACRGNNPILSNLFKVNLCLCIHDLRLRQTMSHSAYHFPISTCLSLIPTLTHIPSSPAHYPEFHKFLTSSTTPHYAQHLSVRFPLKVRNVKVLLQDSESCLWCWWWSYVKSRMEMQKRMSGTSPDTDRNVIIPDHTLEKDSLPPQKRWKYPQGEKKICQLITLIHWLHNEPT